MIHLPERDSDPHPHTVIVLPAAGNGSGGQQAAGVAKKWHLPKGRCSAIHESFNVKCIPALVHETNRPGDRAGPSEFIVDGNGNMHCHQRKGAATSLDEKELK